MTTVRDLVTTVCDLVTTVQGEADMWKERAVSNRASSLPHGAYLQCPTLTLP